NYPQVFNSNDALVYKDDLVSIYLTEHMSQSYFVYAYKNPLRDRILTDIFFLHIYIKDNIELKNEAPFLNLDFSKNPTTITYKGEEFSVFERLLRHDNYPKINIDPHDIDYFNTGRYRSGLGRSQSIDNIHIDPSKIGRQVYKNSLETLTLTVKEKAFQKIRDKRNAAVARGVLVTENDDYIKGTLDYMDKKGLKTELRLKGDWTDHLLDERKWSYRFLIQDGNTLNGMRKLSVQHPKVRNYLWEWIYNKVLKEEEVIALRYDFVNFNIKLTTPQKEHTMAVGVMAVEESFDKILIENNRKRAGVIIAFDESYLWNERAKEYDLGLPPREIPSTLQSANIAPIKVYNEGKVLSDPVLAKQFATAKDLLDGLRKSTYKVSEVFDLDKLSTFVALTNLFGGSHGLIWHNIRVYYNPITNKLEPISYDSNSGTRLEEIVHYPFSEKDPVYKAALIQKLKAFSHSDYINAFLSRYDAEIRRLNEDISYELGNSIDLSFLEHNSNFIKKAINPSNIISAGLLDFDEKQMRIQIENLSDFPVEITSIAHADGRPLGRPTTAHIFLRERQDTVITFDLNRYFVNAFVSKKNKKGSFVFPKDIAKLRIAHEIQEVGIPRTSILVPYTSNPQLETAATHYRAWGSPNITDFPFLEINGNVIRIPEGTHVIDKTLTITQDMLLEIAPGAHIDLINDASIISKSAMEAIGSADKEIKIYSSDHTGGGIFITNASTVSTLHYCSFESLSFPSSPLWNLSGGVNFHESEVNLSHVTFKNNRSEDALNIIRTVFTMTDSTFENTKSDAFDGDFVKGTILRSTFTNSGNDGIDISGSELYLEDIVINNPSDKAISAGENSRITGKKIRVIGGEIGVVSKDLSSVVLSDLSITDTRLGLSAFQKKSEYGTASISIKNLSLAQVEQPHLIEIESQLLIDGLPVTTVSNSVIDQMYGKEYGKSSK
ncbi:MAG: hypothetical protein ACI86L_000264, partial [Dokdonia sp.]